LLASLLRLSRSMFCASVGLSTTALGSERALIRTSVMALRMLSRFEAGAVGASSVCVPATFIRPRRRRALRKEKDR
jgi:hypothetical protein